jgi:hypothetical protein
MTTWHAYGMTEGMPRLLDLWDRHNIKVTSHMVGHAVELQPDLAKDLVARGHEAPARPPCLSLPVGRLPGARLQYAAVVAPFPGRPRWPARSADERHNP